MSPLRTFEEVDCDLRLIDATRKRSPEGSEVRHRLSKVIDALLDERLYIQREGGTIPPESLSVGTDDLPR